MYDDKTAIEMIVEDYRRETGEDVSVVADVYLDRARAAHQERIASTGHCPGGYCCDGTGEPEELDNFPEPDYPICAGECGRPTGNPSGMCYECQCVAHREGWYDMDEGRVR